jgi:hypothetical protein
MWYAWWNFSGGVDFNSKNHKKIVKQALTAAIIKLISGCFNAAQNLPIQDIKTTSQKPAVRKHL